MFEFRRASVYQFGKTGFQSLMSAIIGGNIIDLHALHPFQPIIPGTLQFQDIELLSFSAFKRVCATCCDPAECVQVHHLDAEEASEAFPKCPRPDFGGHWSTKDVTVGRTKS